MSKDMFLVIWKKLLVTVTRRGLDALKTAIKKVAHVAAEAT